MHACVRADVSEEVRVQSLSVLFVETICPPLSVPPAFLSLFLFTFYFFNVGTGDPSSGLYRKHFTASGLPSACNVLGNTEVLCLLTPLSPPPPTRAATVLFCL